MHHKLLISKYALFNLTNFFLLIACSLAGSFASFSYSQSLDTPPERVTIALNQSHRFRFAGYYAAIEKGYYEELGLEVTLNTSLQSQNIIDAVINGHAAQYGVSDYSLIQEYLDDKPVILVAQIFQRSDLVFLTKPKSNISEPNDLVGKKIAYNYGSKVVLDAMISEQLSSSDDIYATPLTEQSEIDYLSDKIQAISALSSGLVYQPELQNMRRISPRDYGIEFFGDNFFTSKQEYQNHPNRLKKMYQATLKGWRYALENPQEISLLIKKKYAPKLSIDKLNQEAKAIHQLVLPELISVGHIDQKRIQNMIELYGIYAKSIIKPASLTFIYHPEITEHDDVEFTQKEKAWIKSNPVITLGGTPDWAPFDYADNQGKHKGLVNDYARLLEEKTGLKIKINIADFASNIKQLKSHNIDFMGGVFMNEKRKKSIHYLQPFLSLSRYFFIRDDLNIKTLKDLDGKRVAIPDGFLAINLLEKHFPKVNIVKVRTVYEAIDAVIEGNADLLYGLYPVLNFALKQSGVTNIIPFKSTRSLSDSPIYFVCRNNSPELISILEKGFAAIDGHEREKIHNKWLQYVPELDKNVLFTQEELEWITAHRVVTYGAEKDWQPFNFMDEKGEHKGISKDFLDKISALTGITFTPVLKNWTEVLRDARQGKIDLLPALLNTKARQKYFTYSNPYIINIPYFFIRSDVKASFVSDLDGLTAAIPDGYIYAKTLKKHFPHIKVIRTKTVKESIDAVLAHRADILVDSHTAMSYLLNKDGVTNIRPFKSLSANVTSDIYMAASLDNQILIDIVNKSMKVISPAEKQAIMQYWLGSSQNELMKELRLTPTERQWLKDHPVINFAGDPKWKPFEFIDKEGNYLGIVAEYLKIFEKMLDIKFKVAKTKTWFDTLKKVNEGKVGIISEVTSSQLTNQLIFTHSYLSTPIVVVANTDVQYVDKLDQLVGKKVGVIRGYGYIEQIKQKYPGIDFVEVLDIKTGLLDLSTNHLDFLLSSLSAVTYKISEIGLKDIRVVGKTEFSSNLAFGVSPKYAPLVSILNKAMSKIDEKEKKRILDEWGDVEFAEKTDYSLLIKVASGLFVILLVIWTWNRRLAQEVSKRKQSEDSLNVLNQRFQLATEAVSFGVWELLFQQGKSEPKLIIDNNMRAIYKLTEDQELDWRSWLKCMEPEDRHAFEQAIGQTLDIGGNSEMEIRLLSEQSVNPVVYTGMCLASNTHEEDSTSKIVGINWDISQIKETQVQLKKAKEIAESANKAKSEFLANMSHEIRTPMNAILGFTELLDDQIKDKRLKAFVKTISSAGKNLLSLINDILDLSKIESGKFEINKTPCNPHHLLSEIGDVFMMRVREKNLDLILDIAEEIPESLHLDAVRVRQILFNLIGNAVKFTETGYIRVRARSANEDDIRSKVDLIIEVEDTGIGIPDNQQSAIFREFEQTQGQDAHKYGGTGLGLSISYRLAKMMGGTLSVKSQFNTGSTFTLALNAVDISSISLDLIEEETSNAMSFQFHPAKILVVDDVEENRALLLHNFEETALEVHVAKNGQEAVEKAKKIAFDLIFMDIRMPVMDGYEASKIIKSLSNTPIVALTASVMEDEFKRIKSENFDGYLRKPVLRGELFNEIARFIDYDEVELNQENNKPSLSDEEKQHAQTLLPELKKLKLQCEQLSKNNDIGEIRKFVNTLIKLNENNPVNLLEQFTSQMGADLDSFNIAGIKQGLENFKNILEDIAEQS